MNIGLIILGATLLIIAMTGGFILSRRWSDLKGRARTVLAIATLLPITALTAAIYGEVSRSEWTGVTLRGADGQFQVKAGRDARCLRAGAIITTPLKAGGRKANTISSTDKGAATRFGDALMRWTRLQRCPESLQLPAGGLRQRD